MNLLTLFLVIESAFVLGGIGMAWGSHGQNAAVRRARGVKTLGFFIIVHVMLLANLAGRGLFLGLCALLALAGLVELIWVSLGKFRIANPWLPVAAILFYGVLAFAGLWGLGHFRAGISLYVYTLSATLDAYSQIWGQLVGRHPLAPRINPAKTIEGACGGLLCATLAAVLLRGYAGLSLSQSLAAGVILSLAGIAGDLTASAYKRFCGVKDYSAMLPGQGGVLDRFNSFWVMLPSMNLFL